MAESVCFQGAFLPRVLADGDRCVIAGALFEPRPAGIGEHPRRSHRDEAGHGVLNESSQHARLARMLAAN
ncbi:MULTISPECIES: hypothetical protein [unclassified Rhodanobacter]|uniref:Uncharacterized protein n=1 Tax=Rhodanobacter humi TaxID=1888173 RepID=A0ABV4APE8_9GAMM